MMNGWNTTGFGGLWFTLMALCWVSLVVLTIWGISKFAVQRNATAEPDALEIVRRRYARGDINHEQYEQMRESLRAAQSGTV